MPIVDPTLGNGGTLAGITMFRADEDPDTPRSTFALALAATDTESWMVGAGGKVYLDENRYRLTLPGGYASVNLNYYG